MEAIDCVKLDVYRIKHLLDDKLLQLTLIRSKMISYKPEVINDLDEMIEEYDELLRNTYDLINKQFLKNFYPFIDVINPLIMNPSEHAMYKFVSGQSPWKFLLKQMKKDEIKNIKSTILHELTINGLSKCKCPIENGTVVLASEKGNIYRAFIIEAITKIFYKIMDIDTGEISAVTVDSLNDLPKSLVVFPPQVFYCTLLKDRFYEKYWTDHLSKMFIGIMKKMKFSVTILEQITTNPPCFEVQLTGNKNGKDINITSDWLYKMFFRNMDTRAGDFELLDYDLYDSEEDRDEQLIDEQIANIEELNDDNYENDTEFIKNVFASFSKRYVNGENINRISSEQENREHNNRTSDDEYEENIAFLKAVFSENCGDLEKSNFQLSSSDDEDESNIALFETDIREKSKDERKKDLDKPCHDKEEDKDLTNHGSTTHLKPYVTEELKDKEKGCILLSSPKIEDEDPQLEDNIRESVDEEDICKFQRREPIIHTSEIDVEENMSDLGDEYGCNITLLETDIGEECKDEVKTCKFHLKEGHCWKEFCPREHINPGPGYIGSVWTYGYFDGEYPLPEEQEIIYVKPKMIISGHIFYGHLIDHIKWNQPDLKLLETRMNSREEFVRFEHFLYLPTIGELCLAYGKSKRWYRARIVEVDEIEVQVLSVDYGYGEKVSLKCIRKMKHEYLFLPPQAIRCEIYGIKAIQDRKNEAKQYLRDVALNETFKAIVRESYQQDSFMEISLICPSGLIIEKNLIAKGYYSTIKSSSQSTIPEE